MDIASLRSELEQHLKGNPHDEAPNGFRDRFDQQVEHLQAEDDAEMKAALETQLRSIIDEAEAAATTGGEAGGEAPAPRPNARIESPGDPRPDPPKAAEPAEAASTGRYGIGVAILAALAIGAFFYFRG